MRWRPWCASVGLAESKDSHPGEGKLLHQEHQTVHDRCVTKQDTVHRMLEPGVIAIVRATHSLDFAAVCESLLEGGVRAVEMTLTTPDALKSLRSLPHHLFGLVAVGMGTVLTEDQAKEASDAGAQFIVTPVFNPDVVAFCLEADLPLVCGSYTPTECEAAHSAGADFIKLFPADGLGPSYVKSILAPLHHLKIIPTGGVTLENCRAFMDSGCVAIGVGGALLSADLVSKADWPALSQRAREFVNAVQLT